MGQSLDQILAQVSDRDTVNVAMVSNQDNGIVSYAIGGLIFHKATGGIIFGGPPFRPARLESDASEPFQMFFSDRKLNIDPAGTFGDAPRQPFNANATEKLGVSIFLGTSSHCDAVDGFRLTIANNAKPNGGSSRGIGTIAGQLCGWCLCGGVYWDHPPSPLTCGSR